MAEEKKKVDPGWNDPPMLNYDASNPPPKSRITNKRVAFPLNKNTASSSGNCNITSGGVLPIPFQNNVCRRFDIPLEELFQRTTENIDKLLVDVSDNDVKSKINAISILWIEGKFPVNIQEHIYQLTQNLVEKNISEVNSIQLKIAMEAGAVSGVLLPAIKHLTDSQNL